MKRILKKTLMILVVLFFVLVGCSAPTPEPQLMQETAVAETVSVTETAAVEITTIPTETTEPFACTIAFDSDRDGNKEIYRMDPDGSNQVNLTNDPADDFDPVWSPDGSQIAFVSNRENETPGQFIYVMNADGSELHQLTYENGSEFPDWSHDGSALTYTSNGDIYVIDVDGSGQSVNLTNSPEKEHRSSWSPDGSLILFTMGEDQNQNIYVIDPDGSNKTQVTDNGRNHEAKWTIDGRIFTGWGWVEQEQFCNNCVVNPDGSDIREAGGKGMLKRYFPFWTVDGEHVECASLAFNDSPTADIYLIGKMFPDGLKKLTNSDANEQNVDWPANCGEDPMMIGYAGDDPSTQSRRNSFQRGCDELALLCPSGSIADLVAQGVDAIVVNSLNGIPMENTVPIQSAVEAGIPVFLLDAELDMEGVYSVTIDQAKWSRTGLEWMFEKMGGEGQFAYFDLYPAFGHVDVINETISKYPEITVVDHQDAKDDPWASKPITADLLKSNPEIEAIWTNGFFEDILQGVAEESGVPMDKWPLFMCEGSMSGMSNWRDMLQRNPNFECMALGRPSGVAYNALYTAFYLLNGEKIDPSALAGNYGRSLFVDFLVVTSENRQDVFDNNPNLDQFMSPEEILEKWFLDQ